MPPFPLPPDDIKAVAEYLHSVLGDGRAAGRPPEGELVAPEKIAGRRRRRGQTYFAATCASCHSVTGDLKGIASRVADPRDLQNLWVSGGGGRGRGARRPSAAGQARVDRHGDAGVRPARRRTPRAHRRLLGHADQDDGTRRTFARTGDEPKVEVTRSGRRRTGSCADARRQGHAQRDGISLDDQVGMNHANAARVILLAVAARLAAGALARRRRLAASIPRRSSSRSPSRGRPTPATTPARRYSSLTQINQTTVKNLGLAWLSRGFVEGSGPTGRGGAAAAGGPGGGAAAAGRRRWRAVSIVGGRRQRRLQRRRPGAASPASILMVDGVLYPTSPDNLWAVDARDGTILWQYYWKTRGGTHTGTSRRRHVARLSVHGDARRLSR